MPTVPRATKAAAGADKGMLGASIAAETPEAAQSLARSPARPSDTSIDGAGVIANGLRQRVARLRHAVASDQQVPGCGIIGQCRGGRAALEDIETERGVADRPRHHHAVAGLRAEAMDHLARGNASERRDRNHQRARRRDGIAAEQRTAIVCRRPRRARARTARARHRRPCAAPGSAGNPQGVAPLEARSDRFTRSALRATVSGGSSGRKCTPSTMASVFTTRSSPVALRIAASSTRPNAPGSVASGLK